MDTIDLILRRNRNQLDRLKVVTGFDGFVDEMISLVNQRKSLNSFTTINTIDHFGNLVKAAAGHSSLREIIVTKTTAGGCAINMGDGLAKLGVNVTTYATVGNPIHSAFHDYTSIAKLHSWGDTPGRTLAYEFSDGKLMFSSVSHLADFTPNFVKEKLAEGTFIAACKESKLIALTDWTLFPHMTACWQLIEEEVFSKLTHRPHLFLDLVDPSTRSDHDICQMLKQIQRFESHCQTILGLNKNEANIISRQLGLDPMTTVDVTSTERQVDLIRARLGISEVVIHTHKFASSSTESSTQSSYGPYCERPKQSTGAGDRFNAGYALALILDLPQKSRLEIATATSGLYVRHGESPDMDTLIQYFEQNN